MNWGMQWPDREYPVVLADPPWNFRTYSNKGRGRSVDQHYVTMTRTQIRDLPVADLRADSSVLLLWVPSQDVDFGIEQVMPSWGFTYKTDAFIWCKTRKHLDRWIARAFRRWQKGEPIDPLDLLQSCFVMTKGYHTRKQAEICLLGTTKRVPPRLDKGVPELIVGPRREHSRKPDEQYERIERLYDGPYLELFARQEWSDQWDVWGLETDKFEVDSR